MPLPQRSLPNYPIWTCIHTRVHAHTHIPRHAQAHLYCITGFYHGTYIFQRLSVFNLIFCLWQLPLGSHVTHPGPTLIVAAAVIDNPLQAQAYLPTVILLSPLHLFFDFSAVSDPIGACSAPGQAQLMGGGNQWINAPVSSPSSGGPGFLKRFQQKSIPCSHRAPLLLAISIFSSHILPFLIPVSWDHLQIYH